VLEQFMRLAHPVMPFITEEIWQRLPHQGDSVMMAEWPEAREDDLDDQAEADMGYLREVISGIRRIRSELKIPSSRKVPARLLVFEEDKLALAEANLHHIVSQARLSGVEFISGMDDPSAYARGLVEAYKALGVPQKEIRISIVLHGPTAYWVLKDEPYRQFKNDEFAVNPNEHVIQGLLQHGVSVEVCNVTLRGKGWDADDVLPGVTIVRDAYTRIIDLQQQGYSYIRF